MDRRAPVFGAAAASGAGNRQRGYFGDVSHASDATAGPGADRTMGANGGAGKAMPFAYQFKSAGGGHAALSRKLHAHSEHALPEAAAQSGSGAGGSLPPLPGSPGRTPKLSLGSTASASYNPYADVPERALQPKVFVPHARASGSGSVPRKVAVERKRREYAALVAAGTGSSGLEAFLKEQGVDYTVPGGDATAAAGNKVANPSLALVSELPLEAFDSSDFEIRTPAEWIALGMDETTGLQRGVPGLALCLHGDGTGYWRACRAVSFDAVTSRFTVVWTSEAQGGGKSVSRARASLASHIASGRAMEGEAKEGKDGWESKESEAKLLADVAATIPGATGAAQVPRIHLCFASEDPLNFCARLGHAFTSRREAADLLRYQLYIDCMPTDDAPVLPPEQVEKLVKLCTAAKTLQPGAGPARDRAAATLLTAAHTLLQEVQTDFARSMNKLAFDRTLAALRSNKEAGQDPAAAASAAFGATAGGLPTDVGLLAVISVPPPPAPKPAPELGMITIPPHDYRTAADSFTFNSLLTKEEVIQALMRIGGENAKITHKGPTAVSAGFLPGHTGKSSKLDEFDQAQAGATAAYAAMLKDGWCSAIRNAVRQCLGNVGKGHFNLKESNSKAYEYSKLRRLLRMINYRMADELRYVTDGMLADYAASIESSCEATVTVVSTNNVVVSHANPGSAASRRPPLFAVDVAVKDEPVPVEEAKKEEHKDGKDGKDAKKDAKKPEPPKKGKTGAPPPPAMRKVFTLNTPPAALVAAPVAAFDKALKAISGLIQVERQVMDRLFWPEEPVIPTVHPLEPHVAAMRDAMTAALTTAVAPLDKYLATFAPYINILNLDVDAFINSLKEKFVESGFGLAECKSLIAKHRAESAAVLEAIPASISLGIATVSAADVRAALSKKHRDIAENVLRLVSSQAAEISTDVIKSYDYMIKQLSAPTTDIESLTNVKEFMAACPEKIKEQMARMESNAAAYAVLEEALYALPKDQFDLQFKALSGPGKVYRKVAEVEAALEKEKNKYMEDMAAEQLEFADHINGIAEEVSGIGSYGKLEDTQTAYSVAMRIKANIEEAENKARLFNAREGLFGKDLTDYDRIGEIKKNFEPFLTLWDTTYNWLSWKQKWLNDPFVTLDAEAIEKDAGGAARNMIRSVKAFEKLGNDGCLNVAKAIRDETEAFKPNIPLIVALRNPGMRERHWTELSDAIGAKVDPEKDRSFSLATALDMHLTKYLDVITKVGEKAGKEYQLEQALDKMSGEWQSVFLDIHAYRETGTYVIKGVDEMQALLDENTTMTQAMTFSAFKKPFAERIDQWAQCLMTAAEVLDEWLKVQRSWLYLQPIFDSADIQKQLPTEYKRFATVDKNWRATLLAARGGPGNNPQAQKAIQFCNNPKLLEKWKESNTFLEMVQKGLSDYLETKRAGFSRFYFLSNDELLEILSQTKDPRAVQPHLKKCFEGVRTVEFKDNLEIVVMVSGEKEKITLSGAVDPKGKNVEAWMSEFERMMTLSVKHVMFDAIADYTATPRTEWVQKWPGQTVLNGSQLHWTREIEEGIKEKGAAGVEACYQQQIAQLKDMVMLIRGKLPTLARITLGSLTVIDVHARDVTKKLAAVGVSTLNDFEWISQMRYYWLGGDRDSGDLMVQMISANRPYGYEYLGNSLRLVITPLTDKCYMTLMGALQMNLGGAPAGPAGTGKTETTKDLAKALAMYCVVFNCSDGLDYLAMGKFFKGLASCGAWACFDEFNRIDVEVLSVVAQQVLTLQEGVRAGLTRIFFEGSEINLNARFAAFITMNPGYAGRSELPDNLKALFRPVAMMVPDYALIGEIMLYSFGFEHAFKCAAKMVATFKLCSEQLSSQDHYDYGMRAVKTVITAAGNLKRAYPDDDEELLLYRALTDVNLPKFLAPDLPLFKGIMSDLFPGIGKTSVDHGDLSSALILCTEKRGLQPVPHFISKCIQVYETVVVRHGMMTVGPTGGGKTSMVKVTQAALTLLANKGRTGSKIAPVHIYSLNPKSITMGQMYGQFDDNTHEWTDGILADMVRECASSTTPDLKWVIFDGPVDAIWIENMNTVLDDNKKLCLVSGEIIALSNEMTIMFEVEDLAVASPATVSRCGMVYTEPVSLGYDVLVQSWIEALPPAFSHAMKATLQAMMDIYVKSTLYFLRRYLVEPVPTVDNQLVRGLLNLMDCFFEPFAVKEGRDPQPPEAVKALAQQLPAIFMFCVIWSVAATSNTEGRKRFNAYLRTEMESGAFPYPLPDGGLIYDYCWDMASAKWVTWMSTVPTYEVPKGVDFSEITVSTKDTVRYKYLAKNLLMNKKAVLMTGPTGTGKTVNMTELLSVDMPKEYVPLTLTFSAQTSANQTQDIIDGKMEKRQRGAFGPPAGSFFVLFVDDLNMPQKEVYGAQPPIELLRQWCDYGGWFDRRERVFRKIVDTVLLGAMGPPGGGRNPVTARMIRHFNVVNYTPMDDESMRLIFQTILVNFLGGGFPEGAQALGPAIVQSTIQVYNTIIDELLPTPSKPHYTFNLRDLGKVFQGMLMADAKRVAGGPEIARMWVHEVSRTVRDRLINDADRTWFDGLLREKVENVMKLSWDDVRGPRSRIIYGDYMVPGAEPKIYCEVDNMEALQPTIEEYLNDYNAESKTPMKLVMFLDAIEHVSRISRIIRQPGGNALLLGVGGSGRQSLTRLATFMADYHLFTIEISKGYGKVEWRDDLKKVLMKAGVEEKATVFLFNDTQIIFEGMSEDINNILNSGDVPNLYAPEDIDAIMNACRNDCLKKRLPPTKINVFAQYLIRVKRNIHLVLAFSPMGDAFRNRLRMFPALVNCTTIDWFSEWPDEALKSVAMYILMEKDLALGEHLPAVVEFFKFAHQGVSDMSKKFAAALRRHNYVTPTSYLELLNTFKNVLQKKREEVGTLRNRLQVGLDKIISTEEIVSKLQTELVEMQPKLAETQKTVAEMIVQIDKDKLVAAAAKEEAEKEEAEAQKQAAATKAIADDAQADLDKALPALEKAVECVDKLKKSDIDEVKSMRTPPKMVKVTLQAACIMFSVKPKLVNDPDNMGKKIKDWWGAAQGSLLADAKKLVQDLKDYDKDNIPEAVIQEVEPLVQDPEFTFENVDKSSKACSGICLWVHAMHTYFFVAKNVEPKKAKLREAQESLDKTMSNLAKVKASLQAVQDKIARLEADFNAANAEKERLAKEVATCAARLDRAHKLLGGLGGEKGRWIIQVAKLNEDYTALIGDALVSSSTIAYLGAFTSDFRRQLVEGFQEELVRTNLPHTQGCNVISTLADPVQVRAWNLAGLPTDQHSVENGIIMARARRWPLLVDPQGQANRYIKNMGKDKTAAPNGIDVLRQSEKKFLQGLENGIRFGKWVLVENVGESLDAALEPVLLQQVFKQGGSDMIKLGDSTVPYNSDFRMFMTSTLPNPHYAPETQVKVSLLNFTITPKGLEDQLLGVFVVTELPELEEKKNALMLANARNKKELADIENRILFLLSNSKGNILDDQELIETLSVSKVKAADITAQVKEAEVTEKEIDATREIYRPVAFRASILYFSITDLSSVDPMYQYSLPWFTNLFVNGIRNSPPADDPQQRITNLNDFFTYSIYKNVCRSLFEVHKPLFSLLMTIKVMQGYNLIDAAEWRFVISGQTPTHPKGHPHNPAPDWITDKMWSEVVNLSTLEAFTAFADSFSDPEHLAGYRAIFDSNDSHTVPIPGKYSNLTGMQRMCVLRCIRPDKLLLAAQDFVIANSGQRFVEPPPFEIMACYEDSSITTPLIFVLSAGSDPTRAFFSFAESVGMRSKVEGISLGQGQGVIAAKLIEEALTKGSWVLLQNCHLAASWMPELERIVEGIEPDKVSRDFRLWLTSMPSKAFPVSVLQNGVKMTNEPPKGLKANIRNFYYQLNDEQLQQTTKPVAFRKLLFGLAFFHAVVQERKRFGPLGWNRPYDFNESDLEISMRQLMMFLDEYEIIPYRVLHTLTAYINYGGRVTDDKDGRTIDVILRTYFTARILDEDYKFTPSGTYYSPTVDEDSPHKDYMAYIDSLPMNAAPEVFGMHPNANITCELNETEDALDILLSLQPRTASGGGRSREDIIADNAKTIESQLLDNYDIESIQMQYPVLYNESMNTVLVQECIRYNKLLTVMKKTLADIQKALKGLVVMSKELDEVGNALAANKVPGSWESKAYPSLKPLAAWVADLVDRLNFIGDWVEKGTPAVYWISGFFFPQAFLTGTMQNYARKKDLPIDTLNFDFDYQCNRPWEGIASKPEDGCYIRGLFLEGARFDQDIGMMNDSIPKQLFTALPVIHLVPVVNRQLPTTGIYRCPLYKILSRWGVLATTGHSSNFVMYIEIPTDRGDITNNEGFADCGVWVRAGVAAFTQLKF